jgi:excisionase family DNA binding protein
MTILTNGPIRMLVQTKDKRMQALTIKATNRSTKACKPAPGLAATDNSGPLLDYKAAAEYLATSPRHVRQLWSERRVAAVKVGRSVRFRRADLDAYVQKQVHPALR